MMHDGQREKKLRAVPFAVRKILLHRRAVRSSLPFRQRLPDALGSPLRREADMKKARDGTSSAPFLPAHST